MKKLIYVLVALMTISLSSCVKNELNPTIPTTDQGKGSGLIADGPEYNKMIKYEYSQEFMTKGRTMSFVKGKKVLDLSVEDANAEFQTASKTSKGSWSGGGGTGGGGGGTKGNGGSTGGTTGGGGTTTQTDWYAPRVSIGSPTPGQNYTLATGMYEAMDCTFYIDDETRVSRILVTIRGDIWLDTTANLKSGYGNWNVIQFLYPWTYGDGTYDVNVQAWDGAGNTTKTTVMVSRNTQMTPLPTNFPSTYILPFIATNEFINQGGEGSCASFAVASQYAIDRYVNEGQTGGFNGNNVYSAEWLYNICIAAFRSGSPSVDCGNGSGLIQNMSYLKQRGIPTWNALPYSSLNGCDTTMFTDAIRANAASQVRKGYGGSANPVDRNLVKLKIYQKKPLVFGFSIDYNYMFATDGFIWTTRNYNGGPHAMVVIGYDDSKNAYLCLNSWGTNWGTQGKIWVDYSFFESNASSCHFLD
jgi:hypothetical protein